MSKFFPKLHLREAPAVRHHGLPLVGTQYGGASVAQVDRGVRRRPGPRPRRRPPLRARRLRRRPRRPPPGTSGAARPRATTANRRRSDRPRHHRRPGRHRRHPRPGRSDPRQSRPPQRALLRPHARRRLRPRGEPHPTARPGVHAAGLLLHGRPRPGVPAAHARPRRRRRPHRPGRQHRARPAEHERSRPGSGRPAQLPAIPAHRGGRPGGLRRHALRRRHHRRQRLPHLAPGRQGHRGRNPGLGPDRHPRPPRRHPPRHAQRQGRARSHLPPPEVTSVPRPRG
jgi:hypothetical protein